MSLECIGMPLSDEELAAAQGGSPPARVLEHLDRCGFCRAELAAINALDNRLGAVFGRRECPDSLKLVDYSMGYAADDESSAIAAHVRECQHCTEELASYAELDASPALASLPPGDRAAAAPGLGHRFAAGLRVVIAQMLPPNRQLQPIRNLRGPRPVDYEAPGLRIQLFQETGTRPLLHGKVSRSEGALPPRLNGALAQVFAPASELPLATAFIKAAGTFAFELEPPPGYVVRLTLADATIVVPSAP